MNPANCETNWMSNSNKSNRYYQNPNRYPSLNSVMIVSNSINWGTLSTILPYYNCTDAIIVLLHLSTIAITSIFEVKTGYYYL